MDSYSIEISLRSKIADDSFDAVEIRSRISRIKAYVPSTDYSRIYEIRGNWSDEKFALTIPERFLESRFPLRLQAQFPGGSKLSVEAKVFSPTRVDLVLVARNRIEGIIAHADFSNRTLSSAGVGCELACPGTNERTVGAGTCIECHNSKGKIFKICC